MVHHADTLAAFLRDRLGENLRAVGIYREGDDEWVYLREDLQSAYPFDDLEMLADEARTVHECLEAVSDADLPLGTSRACLHAFDNALIIHFLLGDGTGAVASFEPEVGGRLHAFIDRCREIIEDGSPPNSRAVVTGTVQSESNAQSAE